MNKTTMNNFSLLSPLSNQNAGFSRWTFANRGGETFFLKEFQDVVYPDEHTLSPTLRNNRIRACRHFEQTKTRLYRAINQVSDGNLVRATEFFRHGSHYYLATPRIQGEKITPEQMAALPMADRLLICRTLAHSLMQLHSAGVVHCDIKWSNVLLKRTAKGRLTAKLIDFDAGFFEDTPPQSEEELHFDQSYLAPEGCLFVNGEEAELTCKMDVFAAGILMHEYLTGQKPGFDPEYGCAHVAVLEGQRLELSPKLAPEIRRILQRMLEREPERRCNMEEVFRQMDIFFGMGGGTAPEPKPPVKPVEPPKPPVKPVEPPTPKKPKPGEATFEDYFISAGDL